MKLTLIKFLEKHRGKLTVNSTAALLRSIKRISPGSINKECRGCQRAFIINNEDRLLRYLMEDEYSRIVKTKNKESSIKKEKIKKTNEATLEKNRKDKDRLIIEIEEIKNKYKGLLFSDVTLFLSWNKRRSEMYQIDIENNKIAGRKFYKKNDRFYFNDDHSDIFDLWYCSQEAKNITEYNQVSSGKLHFLVGFQYA